MTISQVTIYREIEELGIEVEITAVCETTKHRGDRDNPPEYEFRLNECSHEDLTDDEEDEIRVKAWEQHYD